MSGFLHGVETIRLIIGASVITEVKSAVIGIVGTAPLGPLNVLTQVATEAAGVQFGSPIPGFTIPKAIEARNAGKNGVMLVVNVYDPTLHNVTETAETQAIANGKAKLDYAPYGALTAIVNQAAEALALDTHYTINEYGSMVFTPRALNGVAAVAEVLATGSFTINGGTSSPGVNKISAVLVNGVDILGAAVNWATSHAVTAAAVATQINTYVSSPNYTAAAVGAVVTITAVAGSGAGNEGFVVNPTEAGDVTTTTVVNMNGGVTAVLLETACTSVDVTYERFDASLVLPAHLIGAIDGLTNARTGFKLLKMANNLFGYKPKLIICPGYAHLSSIANEMAVQSLAARAHYFLDAPVGIIPSAAIINRGPSSTNNFNTGDKRAVLCFPQIKAYDVATDADENRPFSQYLVALMALNDSTLSGSYAASPSNKELVGTTGVEQDIEWDPTDANCEANLLNAAGIVTVVSGFGTGRKAWGNRNASFPTNAKPDSFIAVNRVADILDETVEIACLTHLDDEITPALIDQVVADIEATMRALEQLGRLLPGSTCVFDPADNPPAQVAAGHIVFAKNYLPPLPAERITNKSVIDINLLRGLTAAA